MTVYVYCIEEDHIFETGIKDREFENEWVRLEVDGKVTVKVFPGCGYSWDGCSPKLKLKDMYFGVPEGVLNYETMRSKTYYASLLHDVFYQFSKDIKHLIKREEIDTEFYNILKKDKFKAARPYFWSVRAFGWIWWGWR